MLSSATNFFDHSKMPKQSPSVHNRHQHKSKESLLAQSVASKADSMSLAKKLSVHQWQIDENADLNLRQENYRQAKEYLLRCEDVKQFA